MARIMRINHIAFAVEDLDEAMHSVKENLGGEIIAKFENTEEKYTVVAVQLGESHISLIQATDDSSFIAKFIETRGAGVQHIGLEVDNLEEFVDQLERKGIKVNKESMKEEDSPEALVGPKTGFGVVLQLMQWKEGPLDIERIKQKHRQRPETRVIE